MKKNKEFKLNKKTRKGFILITLKDSCSLFFKDMDSLKAYLNNDLIKSNHYYNTIYYKLPMFILFLFVVANLLNFIKLMFEPSIYGLLSLLFSVSFFIFVTNNYKMECD